MSASKTAPLDGPILPTLARPSVPNFAAMAVSALVAICETAYVGQLGTAALAGFALVFPLVMLMLILTAIVSRFGTEALAGYGIGWRLEFLLVPRDRCFAVSSGAASDRFASTRARQLQHISREPRHDAGRCRRGRPAV